MIDRIRGVVYHNDRNRPSGLSVSRGELIRRDSTGMRLYDQHVHSSHSMDSAASPSASVEAAIAAGLAGITFTEHFDTHPDEWGGCVYNDNDYSAAIGRLRERFGDRIFIGKGIEVCYQPRRIDFILDFLQRHEFDVVMLSVHYFGNQTVHVREHWAGVDAASGTRRYLENVLEAAGHCERLHRAHGRVFDVLGHLDLVKRYTRRFFDTQDVSAFATLIDEILQACLAANLLPEVNTSSLRQDLDETMPGADAMARYAQLGGTAVPLGSDAHRPQDVGAGFDHALAMLRAAGLQNTVMFQQRRQVNVPIGRHVDGTKG